MQRLGAAVFLKNPEYAYRIWAYYNRHIRDFYAAHPNRCLLVSSNALSTQLEAFTTVLGNKLGVQIRDVPLEGSYAGDLFRTTGDDDPLIDLVAAFWPGCTQLLSELDDLADLSGKNRWRARPVRTRLARPDSELGGRSIDVSVVIPCYEQGTLLVEAIASVERSAPPNCELVIVNDGSRQARTLEILDGLKRFGYFVHDQENMGLAGARNAGIGMARGRYILPLDDDNRIRDHYLADAIRVLDTQPEVGVVYGDCFEFGIPRTQQTIPDFDLGRLLRRNYIDACAVLRKQVWIDCQGYDPWIFGLEDWELWIHAAERGWKFHHLHYCAFDYRVRPDSLLSKTVAIEGELRRRIRAKHAELYWKASQEVVEDLTRRLAEQADAHQREVRALAADLAAAQEETSVLREKIDRCTAEIERVKGSWGWRLVTLGRRLDRP
jgi:GT2 family glycosyltransferase